LFDYMGGPAANCGRTGDTGVNMVHGQCRGCGIHGTQNRNRRCVQLFVPSRTLFRSFPNMFSTTRGLAAEAFAQIRAEHNGLGMRSAGIFGLIQHTKMAEPGILFFFFGRSMPLIGAPNRIRWLALVLIVPRNAKNTRVVGAKTGRGPFSKAPMAEVMA